MRRLERGFNIVELMIAVAATGSVAAIATGLLSTLGSERRHAESQERDLRALAAATRRIEEGVRSSAFDERSWTLERGVLSFGDEAVARRVDAFEMRREGDVVRVRIGIAPEHAAPGSRGRLEAGFAVRSRAERLP